jgi:hypothetical protein
MQAQNLASASPRGRFAACWGVLGFSLLLGEAFYKVSPFVLELLSWPLQPLHWLILAAWVAFMGYSEGYRGFQMHYSPRFAARLHWLSQNASPMQAALAPLFCMGFFGTTRKRKIVAYCLTSGIVLLVVFIRMLPQPWRGIIDLGVMVGLGWGLLSVLWFVRQALDQGKIYADPVVSE